MIFKDVVAYPKICVEWRVFVLQEQHARKENSHKPQAPLSFSAHVTRRF